MSRSAPRSSPADASTTPTPWCRTPRRWRRTAPTSSPSRAASCGTSGVRARPTSRWTPRTRSSPRDEDISIVRERTRRMIAHRAHVERRPGGVRGRIPEATIVDADVDLHLDDTVRVFGRVQWQARAGFDDARAAAASSGGCRGACVGRGALLISPGSPRLARADAGGEVEFAAGRTQTTFGLRYLDFAGARVWIIAPAISVDLNDNVALARALLPQRVGVPAVRPAGRQRFRRDHRALAGGAPAVARGPRMRAATRASTSSRSIGSGGSAPTPWPAACASTCAR